MKPFDQMRASMALQERAMQIIDNARQARQAAALLDGYETVEATAHVNALEVTDDDSLLKD